MRKKQIWVFLLAVVCAAAVFMISAACAEAPEQQEEADWTVLYYICGADLESRYGLASENLAEIQECMYYWDSWNNVKNMFRDFYGEPEMPVLREPDRVRVVVQTGGSREWHAEKIGIQIDPGRLQRWEHYFDTPDPDAYPESGFRLKEELPLASMADSETLADFIRWGTNNYPAKKYCLVIWGHGAGSKSGVLIDELFDGARMNLTKLKTALTDGGTVFETILFDACLMGNLETACAVQEYARWMVASEEVVSGRGTAVNNWLQLLYYYPDCDGKELGRWICDTTQIQYANNSDRQAQDLLTWSVIDLSKIPRLAICFDRFMEAAGNIYVRDTWAMSILQVLLRDTEKYGESFEGMLDLGGIFFNRRIVDCLEPELFRDMMSALNDAVVYTARGNGRSAALGISFCYAVTFTDTEMDIYADSCPFRHYLALLDAISPTWEAPEAIYETVDRLPELADIPDYTIHAEKVWSEDGVPCIGVDALSTAVQDVNYTLYRMDEDTGEMLLLGSNKTRMDLRNGMWQYSANEPWMWPQAEGEPCSIEMLKNDNSGALYSIPLQIGSEIWNLRCGYNDNQLEVYGLWEGYDTDSSVMNRNVMKLSNFFNRQYRLLYPISGHNEKSFSAYQYGSWQTMQLNLDIEIMPLPPGTYYLDYMVLDQFFHPIPMESVEFYWDGTKITFPDGFSWEGKTELKWEGWPEDQQRAARPQ